MGKLSTITGVGAAATTLSGGAFGICHICANARDYPLKVDKDLPRRLENWSHVDLPHTFDGFEKDLRWNYKNDSKDCISYLFPKLNFSSIGSVIDATNKVDASTFITEQDKQGSSCLSINGSKTVFLIDNDVRQWRGSFRWLWSFVRGDKGFIVFMVISPSTSEKEFSLSGVFYLLAKNEKGGWGIEGHKYIDPVKKINKDNFGSLLPKLGLEIRGHHMDVDDYWPFLSKDDNMDNLCSSLCKEKEVLLASSWTYSWPLLSFSEQGNEIKKWSENLDTLLSQTYISPAIDVIGILGSLKGKWYKAKL